MQISKAKSKKDILVIDDDSDTQLWLKKILEGAGYHCRFAANVDEGIQQVKEHASHLIILDYRLENEIGFEVVEFLRNSSHYKNIPIVMISASANKKVVLNAFIIGANEFLAKPLNPALLLQTIKKHLKLNELPSIKFEEDKAPSVQVKSIGDLIKINELGFILQSSIKLAPKTKLIFTSQYLKTMGASPCETITNDVASVAKPGTYRNEVKFKGMDEATAKRIRNIKIT
ncbi:MAG: response regulator [Bdellovibrionota bacterium]|nr:response regulator [Bdellovibrionota bacterium]